MKPTKVGLIGWGIVGAGASKILIENAALIRRKLGWSLELAKIADIDLERPRPVSVDRSLLTRDANDILDDPEIEIVVELVGGLTTAKDLILQAIARGKHVVTANKALLATNGREIFTAAAEAGVDVLFEAAVGGGIPIIRSLKEGLNANQIQHFYGILNGTSNYILTRMTEEGHGLRTGVERSPGPGVRRGGSHL